MPPPVSESYREMLAGALVKLDRLISDVQEAKDDTEENETNRRKTEELIWIELRNIKHDRANKDLVELRDAELADRRSGEIERRLGNVEATLKEMAGPYKQWAEVKSKAVWIAGAMGFVVIILWELAKPAYEAWLHWAFGPPGAH